MFETVVGDNGGKFIIAAAAVALALLALVVVFWLVRNRPSSPFLRGGKNRQPRLAVLDAAAVDTRRRLVLVRRDDVEHLIMIGGPTDIVIESRIVDARPAGLPPVAAQAAPASLAPPAQPRAAPGLPAASDRGETASAPRAAPERRAEPRAPAAQDPRLGARGDAGETPRAAARPDMPVAPRTDPMPQTAAATPPVPIAARAPQPVQPPVSAMGQALYGEDALPSRPQPARPAPGPAAARPAPGPAAAGAIPRPAPLAPARSPEDILDAARARVLPQIAAPEPAAQPIPQAGPDSPRSTDARDFERLLDAQISGDLGRLAPASPPRAAAPDRPIARTEPTLEEEMNRMLSEMGNDRKS